MGSRKTIFYGNELEKKFEIALGEGNWVEAREIVNTSSYEIPQISWTPIEKRLGFNLEEYSKSEIEIWFNGMLGWEVTNAVKNHVAEIPSEPEPMSDTEFQNRCGRIERLAVKLEREINDLGEAGNALLMRPRPKDGLTSREIPDEFYSQVSGRSEPATESDFFDYYSFRKMLDYFAHFSKMNLGFSSNMGDRFGRRYGNSNYQLFIRNVLLAVYPTDFPIEITIPTDTNIHYESKLVVLCEELQKQINKAAIELPVFSNLSNNWTYRQHARFLLKLRKEFDNSEILWVLAVRKHWDDHR